MLGVLLLACAVRLVVWPEVFTPSGVRFSVDSDTLYHVLRAERILHQAPGAPWTDPAIDYPRGARILWPPGFDAVLAAATRVTSGVDATREDLERVAAWLPVFLSLLGIGTIGALGARWFGGATGIMAMLLAALLPISAVWGLLGRPDHHVMEVAVFACLLLLFDGAARRSAAWPWTVGFGVMLACGPWIWQGAAMYAGFFALAVLLIHVARPGGAELARAAEKALAVGAALAAGALAISLALSTSPDVLRPRSLAGISAFHAGLLLAVAAYAAALLLMDRLSPQPSIARRLLEGSLAGAGALVTVALAFPAPVAHGIRTLTSGDPLWATVAEVQPLLFGGRNSLSGDLTQLASYVGPILLAPILCIPAFRREWRANVAGRPGLTISALGAGVFLLLTLHSVRFQLYFAPFAAIAGALAITSLVRHPPRLSPALGWFLAAIGTCALAYPVVPLALTDFRALDEDTVQLLRWVEKRAPAEAPAVLAPWEMGHAIEYYAGLPVVASTFGTDVGDGGLKEVAAFLYAPSPQAALEVLKRRGVGHVLLGDPLQAVADAFAFAPAGSPVLVHTRRDRVSGRQLEAAAGFSGAMGSWLYDYDGAPDQVGGTNVEALANYRLVYETPGREQLPRKLFEVVEGVRIVVTGAEPAARVRAAADVLTNQGRRFAWWTASTADAAGRAVLQVPYATGLNGATRVAPLTLESGARRASLAISDRSVRAGEVIEQALEAATRASR